MAPGQKSPVQPLRFASGIATDISRYRAMDAERRFGRVAEPQPQNHIFRVARDTTGIGER